MATRKAEPRTVEGPLNADHLLATKIQRARSSMESSGIPSAPSPACIPARKDDQHSLRRNRNVFVLSATSSEPCVVAGFWQHGDVSVAKFYIWLSQVIVVEKAQWFLCSDFSAPRLKRNDVSILQTGHYQIVDYDRKPLLATPLGETYQPRIFSGIGTPQTAENFSFRDRVLRRDCQCRITEYPVEFAEDQTLNQEDQIVEGAHILPVHFQSENFPTELLASLANGLTLAPTEHRCFDSYYFGIDVDDNYRIFWFTRTVSGHQGFLHPPLDCESFSPDTDIFLREHLRQALLKWVKGDETDYPIFPYLAVALREEAIHLDEDTWTVGQGKLVMETYLAWILFSTTGKACDCEEGSEDHPEWPKCRLRFRCCGPGEDLLDTEAIDFFECS
ncbi:hypothetical protein Hypma_016019 [Hypsizygus marmoreus]|uniref:HNH nuclease domain-containing protein n=1 Tax=Hypsizygus marmoreus TaxID=39966 RepID=A0A369K1P1_HYPMA|nr:hypothetical protein Hypma_016019 [Hypsizygus marmoreus]